MKHILLFTMTLAAFQVVGQPFGESNLKACIPDSIYMNSPTFNENGTPPVYNGDKSIQEIFRDKVGKIKVDDGQIVFKALLDCNGKITDVRVFKSTGQEVFDLQFLEVMRKTKGWSSAIFKEKPVDFEVTFLGAVIKKKIYIGTQMNPPKEWFQF